jgi:hypothetical protein
VVRYFEVGAILISPNFCFHVCKAASLSKAIQPPVSRARRQAHGGAA